MAKLQSLKDLREKVKAEAFTPKPGGPIMPSYKRFLSLADAALPQGINALGDLAFAAYEGSLAAAKALHEAVLHEYWWSVRNGHGPAYVQVAMPEVGVFSGKTDNNPARAWLLAILEALIAQED